MGTKLKITSRSAGTIRHVGAASRAVDPGTIAKALGADAVIRENLRGAPITFYALRRALESRIRSTGGRPSLEGATRIQKIPLKPDDWAQLEKVAAQLSREGISATAGQVASVMVHKQLELLSSSASPLGRTSRRLTKHASGS